MNIFILDECPIWAAIYQCDKHVCKMIVESAQMLSTAHRVLRNIGNQTSVFYKSTHANHPCNVWTRSCKSNYDWHYRHFVALCDEFSVRYGKQHRTDALLRKPLAQAPWNIPVHGKIERRSEEGFAVAINVEECIVDNVVESYRNFYVHKSKLFRMTWKERGEPIWFTNHKGNLITE